MCWLQHPTLLRHYSLATTLTTMELIAKGYQSYEDLECCLLQFSSQSIEKSAAVRKVMDQILMGVPLTSY